MAGAGYKLFNTGDVLTAAQVNTYLQEQTVMVFASSTARTTALSGVLAEGMMSYLQDTNSVEVYNGSSWVNVGNAGDITEVQAGTGISVASGTGPIPVVTNTMATAVDAKGDLIVGTGADTFARLAVGANETRLVADSTQSTGLKYVADTTNYAIAAKGDLLVGTGADTLAALTVGTNGHTLVADSTQSTGLKWAAAAGGSLDYVLLNSGGTALSSTSTSVSFSAQKALFIFIDTASSTNATGFNVRFNNVSTNVVGQIYLKQTGAGTPIMEKDIASSLLNMGKTDAAAHSITAYINIGGTDKTGWKPGTWTVAPSSQAGVSTAYTGNFVYRDTAAITSFQIFTDSGTFDNGTVYIYGAA